MASACRTGRSASPSNAAISTGRFAARPSARDRIEQGKRLVSAGRRTEGDARFRRNRGHGDLLIGADGIHSRTRQLVDPAAPSPGTQASSASAVARGIRRAADAGDLPHDLRTARHSSATPCAIRETSTGSPTWPGMAKQRARASEPISPAEWKRQLLELFADDAVRRATSSARPPTISPLTPSTTCRSCRHGTATRWSSSATPRTRPRRARARARPWPSRTPSSSRSVSATAMASGGVRHV